MVLLNRRSAISNRQLLGLILAGGVAAALGAVAILSTARYLGGSPKPFEQHSVAPELLRSIESLTAELLELGREAREARLRGLLSPQAPPELLDAVAAQLEAMGGAASCRLAAADAYGPKLIKAIYEITDPGGSVTRVALFFERRGNEIAILDVAR